MTPTGDSASFRKLDHYSVDRYYVIRYIGSVPPTPVDQLPLTIPVFQILLSLVDDELHGYALIRDIDARTDREVRLTASTLYGAIARMLDAGLIEESEPPSEETRRRTYRITRAGRAIVRREAERLARAAAWAREKRVLTRTGR